MLLKDLVSPVSFSMLPADRELVQDLQVELARVGLLDPPADGDFGPVSLLALRTFLAAVRNSLPIGEPVVSITPQIAKLLMEADPTKLFPVAANSGLAGRIWRTMEARGYWLNRAPGWTNLIYIEGMNPDGRPNANTPNQFNDVRLVLSHRSGVPVMLGRWDATTEPGTYYTQHPLNPEGAARIQFGQYKAWCVGMHDLGRPGAHEALVQRGTISVCRDGNRDYVRAGDIIDTGNSFGVNQHWGYDMSPNNIGNASAGCLVGRACAGHREFMAIVKQDPRYVASNSYKFITTILSSKDLLIG
ncbi:MAG: peptidoglycan-binding domain-containing protein [Acidobacteriota bacterium]